MYTRRSRKNSKRQKTLGWKGNCQGQLPLSTTYSFSPLSPRRNRATYRLQQSKDHREVTRRNCFIATTKSSSTDFRCEDQEKSYPRHVHSLSFSLFYSLSLSLSLSLDGVDRVRETGLERAPVNTLGQGRRERMDTYRRKRRRDCFWKIKV